ncbi:MAG: SDR family oxidoreductase [Myxococcota bacterium]
MTPFAPALFHGQVALVTGGGTGIGRAIAEELASLGARVAIASRREEHLLPAAEALRARGFEVLTRTCDIREPDAVAALVDAVVERFGKIDVLVNNAGGQFPSAAALLQPKGWDAVIRNNLNGTWYVTHAVATRAMIPRRRGRIVQITANVERGFPGMVHTGAARAGVENMARTLAVEWAQHGVAINVVAPGVIETEALARYGEIAIEAGRRRTPLKRLGTAEEVAHAVVFLASSAASYITGATLTVDGGARLWGDTWTIPDQHDGDAGGKS